MITTYTAAPGIDVVASAADIPGFGSLAINAFVLHGDEPMLVDTGVVRESEEFMTALGTLIDPADLRWIFLSHTDYDHIGALPRLLDVNPHVRVITTFFTVGIMGLSTTPLLIDRLYFLNPGETMTAGQRTLTAIKPPVYDNSVTTGFFDATSGALFSADCFGALLPAVPQNAAELDPDTLRAGQTIWVTIDSPWINKVDRARFEKELDAIRALAPSVVLSGHLPVAPGTMLDRLVDTLAAAPDAAPFVGPDQGALEQMLAGAPAGV
jgi:flavorubredoxin